MLGDIDIVEHKTMVRRKQKPNRWNWNRRNWKRSVGRLKRKRRGNRHFRKRTIGRFSIVGAARQSSCEAVKPFGEMLKEVAIETVD
jgi:hypothetical protein